MTVGKTASELEAMIMENLRQRPACVALNRVHVIPAGEDGGWEDGYERPLMRAGQNCRRG